MGKKKKKEMGDKKIYFIAFALYQKTICEEKFQGTQYFCKRTQIFCERTESFTVERNSFASERNVSWEKAIVLRENAKVL